ncbi:MAG: M56 family metallopeptidase [Rhodothermales bacterium]
MQILELIRDLGAWSIESYWIPILAWTAIALPILVVMRLTTTLPAHIRYRVSLALLYSLPLGIVLAPALAWVVVGSEVEVFVMSMPAITITYLDVPAAAFRWTTAHTAGLLAVLAIGLAGWRSIGLASAFVQLRRYKRSLREPAPHHILHLAGELANRLGLRTGISIDVSETESAPLTFGWRRPLIVLPAHLSDAPDDLRLTLLHELTHIRRRDYALQWMEQVIGAMFFIHPVVALLRREILVLREVTCDADVLSHETDRTEYARLLYRYVEKTPGEWRMAVGIQLRENHLKTRLAAMKRLVDIRQAKRIGLIAASFLFIIAITAIGCSDLLVHPRGDTDEAPVAETPEVFVIVENMPELVGGLASIQANLRYPESAKNEGVEGRVIVQFIVDEEGRVEDVKAVNNLHPDLDAAAVAAVRSAKFKPGLQDGQPVKVKMSLPMTFKLGGAAAAPAPAKAPSAPQVSDDGTYAIVDQMPELIGGLQGLMTGLKYPEIASKAGIEGRVVVQFTVDKQGAVKDAHVVTGMGAGLDEEALRVIRQARFEPGVHKGEPVEVRMALPFTFKLPNPATWTGDVLRIEVDREGKLSIDGRPVDAAELSKPPANLDVEKTMVVLRVDPGAPTGAVQLVQESLRAWAKVLRYESVR